MLNVGRILKMGSAVFLSGFSFMELVFVLVKHNRYYVYGHLFAHASKAQIDQAWASSGINEIIFRCSVILLIVAIVSAFSNLLPTENYLN